MSEWKEAYSDDFPYWQDGGKRVEIKLEDGSIVSGRLVIVDMTPGPDEHPIFVVRPRGRSPDVSLGDAEFWRYV